MTGQSGSDTYTVLLLVEQELSDADAAQVTALHSGLDGPVAYRVLVPVEDAAARIEAAMGSMAAGEVLTSPALIAGDHRLADVEKECRETAEAELARTLDRLHSAGASATGRVIAGHPVAELTIEAESTDAGEAIILTRPHLVAEFFHVDWTSRARRHLGVPVLHLLEHEAVQA